MLLLLLVALVALVLAFASLYYLAFLFPALVLTYWAGKIGGWKWGALVLFPSMFLLSWAWGWSGSGASDGGTAGAHWGAVIGYTVAALGASLVLRHLWWARQPPWAREKGTRKPPRPLSGARGPVRR